MEKFSNFIEKRIAPFANSVARNKYMLALQNAFLSLIPFITIGSLALVIISPPADYANCEGIVRSIMFGWAKLAEWTGPTLGFVNMVTMNAIALYVAIGMGLNLANYYKMKPAMPMLVTAMSFLICATMNADGTLTFDHLGGTGLFTAILVSAISFELYRVLTEKKVGRIDLPGGGVPPALLESLGNLVPTTIVLLVFGAVSQILLAVAGTGFPDLLTVL